MNNQTLRVLLVSVGVYGRRYLSELTEQGLGVELAGIVDVADDLPERFPVIRKRNIPALLYSGWVTR